MGVRDSERGNGGAGGRDMAEMGMERGTEGWREWGEEEIRADLNRRTREAEIDRLHQWGRYDPHRSEEERSRFAEESYYEEEPSRPEGAPPGRYGYGAGPGVAPGWRRRWAYGPELPPRGIPQRGGFGGRGGGAYGGSYGGMGPGPAGGYPPAGSLGGPSGAGSLSGGFGLASGWTREPWEEGRPARGRGFYGRRPWTREGPMVRDLMTRDPRVVGPEAPVEDAARLMREEDAGIIPVCLEGRVLGVVTDRDLTVRVLAEGRDPRTTRVSEVMSGDVQVCTPEDRLIDAIRIMGEENVRRLPVVDRNDRILGILSMTDVAREAEVDYALQEALDRVASRRSFWSRW